jgi:hypothetical protein
VIIIWGWRALTYVLGTGQFFCPRCGGDAPYRHLRRRRWFTFFFLPVIPLEELGTHIECSRCRATFTESVLGAPTLEVLEYHHGLANRAAVAHLASLARPMGAGVEDVALRAISSAPGVRPDYDRAAFHVDVRAFASAEAAATYLRPLAETITIEGREAFLRRASHLVGELPNRVPEMDRAIELFAGALDISPAHLLGIRQSIAQGSTPGSEL